MRRPSEPLEVFQDRHVLQKLRRKAQELRDSDCHGTIAPSCTVFWGQKQKEEGHLKTRYMQSQLGSGQRCHTAAEEGKPQRQLCTCGRMPYLRGLL